MAELITIESFPQSNIAEQSTLTADAAAAQAVISVANVDTLAANDYVLVGIKGSETAQILQVLSIANLAVTFTGNLTVKHFKNEPIYKLKANQAKIYRAANVNGTAPVDADFSVLTTLTLEADQLSTSYNDSGGGSSYWYKYLFYNSSTTSATPIADAIANRGGNYGLYTTVDAVRREAGLQNNRFIEDQLVYQKLIQAQSEANASLTLGGYSLPLEVVPELLVNAVQLLAAGYLLTMDYGVEHTGTNKDGTNKIKMARDILNGITSGATLLIDPVTSAPVPQSVANGVNGYPDSTSVDNIPTEGKAFSITMKF